jgi:hypothetical protein
MENVGITQSQSVSLRTVLISNQAEAIFDPLPASPKFQKAEFRGGESEYSSKFSFFENWEARWGLKIRNRKPLRE